MCRGAIVLKHLEVTPVAERGRGHRYQGPSGNYGSK